LGKAGEVADAIRKGGDMARSQWSVLSLKTPRFHTKSFHIYGRAKVLLRPASPAGHHCRGENRAGRFGKLRAVKDVLSKSLGSNNAANVVKATLKALLSLRMREDIYRGRGLANINEGDPRHRPGCRSSSSSGYTLISLPINRSQTLSRRRHRRKRLGASGESSGQRQNQRTRWQRPDRPLGSSIRIGFEGGQMPLIRRIPKRGFNNVRHGTRYLAVNLSRLNEFADGARVDEAALRSAGRLMVRPMASKSWVTAT